MEIDKRTGWNVHPNGGTWSITTDAGDIIADDIPHGEIAHYIAHMHNITVRTNRNFRVRDFDTTKNDDGTEGIQCKATANPYRCVYSEGHTGPHVTYSMVEDYLFD